MGIVETNEWLEKYQKTTNNRTVNPLDSQRKELIEKLTPYFSEVTSYDIQHHLIEQGMFLPSYKNHQAVSQLLKSDAWQTVNLEWSKLLKEWDGPNIPIFIFPSSVTNKGLQYDFNGKSGLAFADKIFLFITPQTTEEELKALITHEYNHVCRLEKAHNSKDNLRLLDSIVLEGLAESAVEERLGKEYCTKSTNMYSLEESKIFWDKYLKNNLDVRKSNIRHDYLIYGKGGLPKWLGYNAGYHLVSSFAKKSNQTMIEMLAIKSEEMQKGSSIFG